MPRQKNETAPENLMNLRQVTRTGPEQRRASAAASNNCGSRRPVNAARRQDGRRALVGRKGRGLARCPHARQNAFRRESTARPGTTIDVIPIGVTTSASAGRSRAGPLDELLDQSSKATTGIAQYR
jgi:hypothetical protein